MLFRHEYTIREALQVPGDGDVSIDAGGHHAITVTLSRTLDQPHTTSCSAQGDWAVPEAVFEAFEEWLGGKVPPGGEEPQALPWKIKRQQDGSYEPRTLPYSALPPDARVLLRSVSATLYGCVRQTYGVIRWRAGALGHHSPFSSRFRRYSTDGRTWNGYPMELTARAFVESMPELRAEYFDEVRVLAARGEVEPICHTLFREAWEQRHTNLRSALVVGVAALELGVKDAMADLMPDTSWLLRHASTPPLTRMLKRWLPTVRAREMFEGKVLAPPPNVLRQVQQGIELRNSGVHVSGESPSSDDVVAFLEAARDVLWLLDYYRGNAWALDHMREATRQEMYR